MFSCELRLKVDAFRLSVYVNPVPIQSIQLNSGNDKHKSLKGTSQEGDSLVWLSIARRSTNERQLLALLDHHLFQFHSVTLTRCLEVHANSIEFITSELLCHSKLF